MSHVHPAGVALAVALSCAAPRAQDPVEAAPAAAPLAPLVYGRVDHAETALRCFPTSCSPVYGETLGEGDVVVLTGEKQNGYVAVRLPLGALGFVHSRYAQVADDGSVTSSGSNVAFRYRTNAREAPVRFVDDGTAFRLVTTEGEWLQVRFPDQPVWVAANDLVTFPADEDVATIEAGWSSHAQRQQAQIDDAVAKLAAEREAAALLVRQREAIAALAERFRAETQKADSEQELGALRDEAVALVAAVADGTSEHRDAEQLQAAIERHVGVLDMKRVLEARAPEPVVTVEPAAAAPDPLGDYAVGWLKTTSILGLGRKVILEKGGQQLFELDCSTGRYNLDTFVDMEVAIRGMVGRPDPDSIRRLDVRRIEVLTPRR